MAKHFVAVETATGLPDSGKMFAVDPSAASGIALPSFKMVSALPRIGNIIGEGYFVTTSKTAFAWDGRVFQPVVPSAILTYPNDAAVYADNTQPAGSYGASADTGHLFIMSQTGWRMVGSKTYADIAAANADTNVSDGALGWLTAEQVMIIRVGGAWQRIVDTPHVTVSATKPTSPITGDMVFNATTKVAEIYDGAAWSSFGGSVTVSEATPATTITGSFWYQGSTKQLKFYNGSAWVAISGGAMTDAPSAPKVGDLYYNATKGALMYYTGSEWKAINQTATSSLQTGQTSVNSVFSGPYDMSEARCVNIVSGCFKINSSSGDKAWVRVAGLTGTLEIGNAVRHVSGAPVGNEAWNPLTDVRSVSGVIAREYPMSKWACGNSFKNNIIFFVDRRFDGIMTWGWRMWQPENGECIFVYQGEAPTSVHFIGDTFMDGRFIRSTSLQLPF